MSSKYNDAKRLMHSKGDHIQIMIGKKTDKVIKELFQTLRYQISLQTSKKVSNFIFDSIDEIYYKCDEISLNRVGLYMDQS